MSRADQDHTKTRLYAYVDLLTKSISSIALVLLGIAGWLLQARSESSREGADRLERQERRYLPMLRSLSELELVLEHTLEVLRPLPSVPQLGTLPIEAPEAYKAVYNSGLELRYAAYSVFVPDGDPVVSLRSPEDILVGRHRIGPMPLRATALMYAEILRLPRGPRLPGPPELVLQLDSPTSEPQIVFAHVYSYVPPVPPESYPAWKAWLGNEHSKVFKELPLTALISDLHFAVTKTIQETLSAHVDLGDRYLGIRSEVQRDRALLDRLLLDRTRESSATAPQR